MKPLCVTILLTCCFAICLPAQQVSKYTFFQANWHVVNPAAINYFALQNGGQRGAVGLGVRKQWVVFPGSPFSINAKFETMPPENDFVGDTYDPAYKVGLYIDRDQTDGISNTSIYGNYAYFIDVNDDMVLSVGLNAGVFQYRVNEDKITFQHGSGVDPLARDFNQFHGNFALGAFLFQKKVFYAGISIPQVFDLTFTSRNIEDGLFDSYQVMHLALLYGQYFELDGMAEGFTLEPSVLVRYVPGLTYGTLVNNFPLSADFNFRVNGDNFWAGIGYNTAKMANMNIGLFVGDRDHISKGFDSLYAIGLAYAFPVGWDSYNFGTTVEITFSYTWD